MDLIFVFQGCSQLVGYRIFWFPNKHLVIDTDQTVLRNASRFCDQLKGMVVDVIQKILKYLGLDQSVDKPIRSPPADLTDQQTTLF